MSMESERDLLIRVAREAEATGGCGCGWGGQHQQGCPVGAYEDVTSDPALVLRALGVSE